MKKIRVVQNGFDQGGGPYQVTTLGFSYMGLDFILGTFYEGPGMSKSEPSLGRVEAMLNEMVHQIGGHSE